jgi:TetR/AcrR family transcriptional repressor of nem operon
MARTKSFDEKETLRKILALFTEKGYHQSSLEDILQAGGISRQSMYDTYGDKETVFLKALALFRDENIKTVEKHVESELSAGKSSLDILRHCLYQAPISAEENKGCMLVNSMVEFKDATPAIRSLIDASCSCLHSMMKKVILHGQKIGEIRNDLPASGIADILMNARNGLQVSRDYRVLPQELSNTADLTIALIRETKIGVEVKP